MELLSLILGFLFGFAQPNSQQITTQNQTPIVTDVQQRKF